MTAAEMTGALVQINDRLATVARAKGSSATFTFFCECGDCLAEEVLLSVDGHEEIRAREDLIFAVGHDAPRDYRSAAGGVARDVLTRSLIRAERDLSRSRESGASEFLVESRRARRHVSLGRR